MNGLQGKRVLITRPRAQAEELVEKLVSLGAIPILFPTIEIAPLEDTRFIDRAINHLGDYQWVIFTSVNGGDAFWQRMQTLGKDERAFKGIHVAAIGPATAQALRGHGIVPEFVPREHVAEAILPGLGDIRGQRILLPRADIARKALVEALKAQDAIPEEIAVYRTVMAQPSPTALAELEKGIDVATFTSSSTVSNFFAILGARSRDRLGSALIACIGPITAETARSLGLKVSLVASEYTVGGLVTALVGYFNHDHEDIS